MSDEYAAPEKEGSGAASGVPVVLVVVLVATLCLGLIGILNTCFSGVAVITSQLAGGALAANPEQARILEEIQAQQGWWVLPLSILQILGKAALSIGLAVGSGMVLARSATGASILKPTLVYGIVFELAIAIIGMANTAWNWQTMSAQFGQSMSANPGVSTDLADSAGMMFGVTMVVTMVFMFLWAAAKAGLYAFAYSRLSTEEAYEYMGVFED